MQSLRSSLRSRWWLVLLFLAAALAPRWAMPQGYMVSAGETLTVTVCSPTGQTPATIDIPVKGKHDQKAGDAAPCAFGTLSQGMLAGADPVLLAAALVFIIALGFSTHIPVLPAQRAWIRPPLRGPPQIA